MSEESILEKGGRKNVSKLARTYHPATNVCVNPRILREKSVQLSGWTSDPKVRTSGWRTTRRMILIPPAESWDLHHDGKILQLCEVILILLLSSFVKEVASEASRTTLASHDLPQIIRKKLPHRISTFTQKYSESSILLMRLPSSAEKASNSSKGRCWTTACSILPSSLVTRIVEPRSCLPPNAVATHSI